MRLAVIAFIFVAPFASCVRGAELVFKVMHAQAHFESIIKEPNLDSWDKDTTFTPLEAAGFAYDTAVSNLYNQLLSHSKIDPEATSGFVADHKKLLCGPPDTKMVESLEVLVETILAKQACHVDRSYVENALKYVGNSCATAMLWRSTVRMHLDRTDSSDTCRMPLQCILLQYGAQPYRMRYCAQKVRSRDAYVLEKQKEYLTEYAIAVRDPMLMRLVLRVCPAAIVHEPFPSDVLLPYKKRPEERETSPLTCAFFSLKHGDEEENIKRRAIIELLLDKGACISREHDEWCLPYFLATIPENKTDLAQEINIVTKVLAQHPPKKHVQLAQFTARYHVQRLAKTPGSDWERLWGMLSDEILDERTRMSKRVKNIVDSDNKR